MPTTSNNINTTNFSINLDFTDISNLKSFETKYNIKTEIITLTSPSSHPEIKITGLLPNIVSFLQYYTNNDLAEISYLISEHTYIN
jgi:hypothetical protein